MSPIPLGILAASGGAAGAMELISTQLISSPTSSLTFWDIPATFKHLQVRWVARNGGSTSADMLFRINNDTGSNYARHRLLCDGGSVLSNASTNSNRINLERGNTYSGSDFRVFSSGVMDVLDYSSTVKNTTIRASIGQLDANAGITYVSLVSGLWNNTAAVSALTFLPDSSGSFASGTRFSLYGIKG